MQLIFATMFPRLMSSEWLAQRRLVADMRTTWDADVAVHDLNLEEIFVEMHDGSAG